MYAALQVTLSVSPSQGIFVEAGSRHDITCTTTFDEYLVQRPTLIWQFPDGSSTVDTIIMGDQLGIRATTSRILSFNRIRTSQAGVYTCRATIDIQGIDPRSRNTSQTVRVQSKLLELNPCAKLDYHSWHSLQFLILCLQSFLTPLPTMEQT